MSAAADPSDSVLNRILDEFEEIDKMDAEERKEALKTVGGRILDVAQEGMSTVARHRFNLTHRSTVGSIADTGLDVLAKFHAVKEEGPKILKAVSKIAGFFK